MRRVLLRGFQTIELIPWYKHPTADTFLEFSDTLSALDFLHNFLHDSLSMMTLRSSLAEELPSTDIGGLNDQEVLEQLAWRLVYGSLRIVPAASSQPALRGGGRTQATAEVATAEVEEEEEQEQEQATTTTPVAATVPQTAVSWIKFAIVDDDTGQPVADVKLKLKLPDGTVKEYTTDANGLVHITDLPPGTCDIEQMLDADALEVVQID